MNQSRGFALILGVIASCLECTGLPAGADTVTFTASDTGGRSASATFTASASTLTITFANNSSIASDPGYILETLFFNVAGSQALGKSVAQAYVALPDHIVDYSSNTVVVPDAAHSLFGGTATNIAADWAYRNDITASEAHVQSSGMPFYGLSGVGLNVFGAGDVISKNDGQTSLTQLGYGGKSPDGLAMGLIGPNPDIPSSNGGVTGNNQNPLISHTATFVFNISNFDVTKITNVYFQYGTSSDEPRLHAGVSTPPPPQPNPVPLPTTAVAGAGFLATFCFLGLARRRCRA